MAHPTVVAANNFLVPNATFIVEFISFLIILGLVGKLLVPWLNEQLGQRQAIITQQMQDSETAKQALAEAQETLKNALTEARNEAAQIREGARAEAQRTLEELRTQAQAEAARIVARGDDQLASQRSAIVRELRGEIGKLAVELSEKIVSQRLADDAQVSATVDAFLADLERHDTAGSGA